MRIELRNISKYYGDLKANDHISFTVESGSIHGVLGENGAGKSTLMKILSGYIRKSGGAIFLDGQEVDFQNPAQSQQMGIGMLYQDPLDFPNLPVIDNFILGQMRGVKVAYRQFRETFARLTTQLGFSLDPDAQTIRLSVGERQQLEMVRLLATGIRTLILDEPTTGISGIQKQILFQALRRLAREGKSVILVSHKLEDVESLCDRVTVLRQGRVAGEMAPPFDTGIILSMMFGKPPIPPAKVETPKGSDILVMEDVWASGGRTGLRECSTVVRGGEIVGLAGLEGSGQGVFLRLAAGLARPMRGRIRIGGRTMNGKDHLAFRKQQIAFLPSARLEEGLFPGLTLAEHCVLSKDDSSGWFIKWFRAMQAARDRIVNFRVKGEPDSQVESLSGGNQQRFLLSFISDHPKLLLLENPTRGLDVSSAHWVWEHLHGHVTPDTGIVFSSPELDELLAVAHRILVFFDGRIVKDVHASETSVNELGRAIAGKLTS